MNMNIKMPPVPMTLPEAIAREEGYYVYDSRSQRNNNPGNIEYGIFARAYNALHGDPRFAVFPSPEDGFRCLVALLKSHYTGLTIEGIIYKWAPPTENDTAAYVRNICAWTHLTPNTIIWEADLIRTEDIVNAQAKANA